MHLCIATHIGSSLPDLFVISWSPSHSGLCQFKITLFALQQAYFDQVLLAKKCLWDESCGCDKHKIFPSYIAVENS
jgi:hypothetical protein